MNNLLIDPNMACQHCGEPYAIAGEIPQSNKQITCKQCGQDILILPPDAAMAEQYHEDIAVYIQHRKNNMMLANLEYDLKRIQPLVAFLHQRQKTPAMANASDLADFLALIEGQLAPEQVRGFQITIHEYFEVLVAAGRRSSSPVPPLQPQVNLADIPQNEIKYYVEMRKNKGNIGNLDFDLQRIRIFYKYLTDTHHQIGQVDFALIQEFMNHLLASNHSNVESLGFQITLYEFFDILEKGHRIAAIPLNTRHNSPVSIGDYNFDLALHPEDAGASPGDSKAESVAASTTRIAQSMNDLMSQFFPS